MNNTMINKMKNSAFGKFLRRIAGEETGAVMMEYVIVAVLIAAAAVVGIAVFSKTMNKQGAAATEAMIGETKDAVDLVEQNRQEAKKGIKSAEETAAKFHGQAGNE